MNPNFKFFLCKSALWHEFCHACGSLRSGSRTYERTLINVSDIIRENKFNYTVNTPLRGYFLAGSKSVALHSYQLIKYFAELFHAVGFRYNAPEPVFPVISHNGII